MTTLTNLQRFESESIHIIREAIAAVEKPVTSYSIGKGSLTTSQLATTRQQGYF